jgi:hypothetical protein
MKVLVCGSRDWGDYEAIDRRLSGLPGEHEEIEILHGAASRRPDGGPEESADMLADRAARYWDFTVRRFPADWERHGKRAGILRNLAMLNEQPDLVIAFQRNGSRGTQHTIDEARRRGIPVEVHTA